MVQIDRKVVKAKIRIYTSQTYKSLAGLYGFTLIEILVVLVIVSVMTGMVIVRFPSLTTAGDYERESERLIVVLGMASEEAIISGRELGFDIEDNAYKFSVFDENEARWIALQQLPFETHKVDSNIGLDMIIEDKTVQIDTKEDERSGNPEVLIFSSGEVTPFDLTVFQVSNPALFRTIGSDGLNGFRVTSEADEG